MEADRSEVSQLVLGALETALQQEGESRLVPQGKKKGLLPGGASRAKSEAVHQCLDAKLRLFVVREVVEGGKTAYFVVPTPEGIEKLFTQRPAQRGELLEKCANSYKEAVKDVVHRLAESELRQVVAQQTQLANRAAELRESVARMASEQLDAIRRTKEDLDRQAADLRQLIDEQPKTPGDGGDVARTTRRIEPPRTDGDIDFQRDLCRELVFAWQDTAEPDTRAALERVMLNSGLAQVGEVGAAVAFDGREHRTESDLLPGQPAVVVEPGWQYRSPRGLLLIAQAVVAAPAHRTEVNDVAHA
ncbi:MAG TPA: hypothetical protein VM533_18685 [Fimbriiglobus sp.]|nr:hypothetical protein [Fimbriiglobus sp.]